MNELACSTGALLVPGHLATVCVLLAACNPLYPGPSGGDAGSLARDTGSGPIDAGPPERCVRRPDNGALCCATEDEFASVFSSCPPAFTVSCGDFLCVTNSACEASGTCLCGAGYWLYDCVGAPHPCTFEEPCSESTFCGPCPAGASISQYDGPSASLATVDGCPPFLVPCGEVHCYDPTQHVCCADVSFEVNLCYLGDRCLPEGLCADDGAFPP